MRTMPTGIVTGASRGLGLALARALDERDWRLIVDARGAEALSEATDGLSGVTAIAGDNFAHGSADTALALRERAMRRMRSGVGRSRSTVKPRGPATTASVEAGWIHGRENVSC